MKPGAICCIFFVMTTLSFVKPGAHAPRAASSEGSGKAASGAQAAENPVAMIAGDPRSALALKWIDGHTAWITDQQIRMTEIPAPEFHESQRAAALEQLFAEAHFRVRTDSAGNVIAERPGADSSRVIVFVAHLDTVFPAGTDVRVKRVGSRLEAPGIADNGAGLSALVGLAHALDKSGIRTEQTIFIVGDVGEEGEGNLRGMRALVESLGSRLVAVVAVDGASVNHITTEAIASRRFEVTASGPGGHSWSDFGLPNPIAALARGIVRFSATRLPDLPRSSFNFGVIEGGTSVNSIPARASVKVDMRSEDEAELNSLETAMREAMRAGVNEENAAAPRAVAGPLALEIRQIGSRPSGKLPQDSPLLATFVRVDEFLGISSACEAGSTDANVPLSAGIPALAVGGGGRGGGAHTLGEWYDAEGRELGLKRLFLAAVSLAGVTK